MIFESIIPSAFPALALAHFLALLSPGPDFFLVAGHSIRGRFSSSFFICIGISIANAVYIAFAVIGWNIIASNQIVFNFIQLVGACYLGYIGYALIKQPKQSLQLTAQQPIFPPIKQFLLGFTSALLNPKNMVFYLSLMAIILGEEVTSIQILFSASWMFLMVLLYNLLLVLFISQPLFLHLLKKRIHYVEKGAGYMLICLSLIIILKIFFSA